MKGLASLQALDFWLRGKDLNLRPSGYEPDELPDCSTPRQKGNYSAAQGIARVKPADYIASVSAVFGRHTSSRDSIRVTM